MDDADFSSMMRGLDQVADYMNGKREGFVVHTAKVPDQIDVKAIRTANNMTQEVFAGTYGFALTALRDWEQGRRKPDRMARIVLAMVDKKPEAVRDVLHTA